MLPQTKTALAAIIAADPSIPPGASTTALRLLEGRDSYTTPLGRVIRPSEASRLLGVTPRTLRLWALRGALVPVYGGQKKRRTGYTESSIRAILAGEGGAR